MQIEFRAIVQSEYGAPEKVLTKAECQFKSEDVGADDVVVKLRFRKELREFLDLRNRDCR